MKKLYVAILNDGWIRREVVSGVIPALFKTSEVKIMMEPMHLTWGHPISSNRNSIVKRFLGTDADFLLMMDNDVIPLSNPAEMVFADKDIIGFPAKVRQSHNSINWTAYMVNPQAKESGEAYIFIDLDSVDDKIEVLEVDAVGTGAILIKRKVLEALQAPFNCEYDKDGVTSFGTDFAFCRKAKQNGFKVYTAPQRFCEHIKTIGLLQTLSFLDFAHREKNPYRYNLPWGGYSIEYGDWFFIKDIIKKEETKTILEFGSGISSLLMSEQTKVLSYETNQKWVEKIKSLKTDQNDLEIRLWSGITFENTIDNFDLVFIDGPVAKSSGGIGRELAFYVAIEHSDRIIVHDAGRKEELELQNKYLKGDFQLMGRGGYLETSCNYWVRR